MVVHSHSGVGKCASIPISIARKPKCHFPQNVRSPQSQWLGQTIHLRRHCNHFYLERTRNTVTRAGLEEIVHNQVLVSATVAGLGGQLFKPVVPAVLGKGFNWELALNSGGMPSTHSAYVVAAATAIGLERGFSDSLFGLAAVIAGIVMYDAQGVRRAVGNHAEVINMMIVSDIADSVHNHSNQISIVNDGDQVLDSVEREPNSVQALDPSLATSQMNVAKVEGLGSTQYFPRKTEVSGTVSPDISFNDKDQQFLERAHINSFFEPINNVGNGTVDPKQWKQQVPLRHIPLKESVGHTKVEVVVGALFGVIVTLGLHLFIQQL